MSTGRQFLGAVIRKATWLASRKLEERRVLWRSLGCRWNVRDARMVIAAPDPTPRPQISFIIAHRDAVDFLANCIQSIVRHAANIPHEILILDDASHSADFEAIKGLSPRLTLYRSDQGGGHPEALQWLLYRARGRFVVTLDQDSVLLSAPWTRFAERFDQNPDLMMIGVRDQCFLRQSPAMLHPSFIMLHRARCRSRLGMPLFFGPKPGAEKHRFSPEEDYYSMFCRALQQSSHSLGYLDQHQTRYEFGTVAYDGDPTRPVVYHQWYSGRTSQMKDTELIDGLFRVGELRAYAREFLKDSAADCLDLTSRNINPIPAPSLTEPPSA